MTMVESLGSPCPRELTILLTTVPDTFSASNDYHVLTDGAPGLFRLLTQAIQDGVPFDGIGIQAHEPHTMRFPLRQVQTILDRYATLGKELRITEFTPASGGDPIPNRTSRESGTRPHRPITRSSSTVLLSRELALTA